MAKMSARQRQEAGWRKASKEFTKELMGSASGVTKSTQRILVNTTGQFLDYVQMNKEQLPIFTANLHDSIATLVSQSGRIIRASYMPVEATRPQTGPGRKRIVGEEEAAKAVRAYRPQRTGIHAALFVAVPYAEALIRTAIIQVILNGLRTPLFRMLKLRLEHSLCIRILKPPLILLNVFK